MKKYQPLLAISILIVATLACNTLLPQAQPTPNLPPTVVLVPPVNPTQSSNSNAPQTEADVPRIPVDEAKAAFDSGQAIIVDVRDAEAYAELHTAGSISLPLDLFELSIDSIPLPKDQWIITYCT